MAKYKDISVETWKHIYMSNTVNWIERMSMSNATIVSGFPGIGKTHFHERTKLNVLDSDSSKFSWVSPGVRNKEFPLNYMDHIKENRDKVDIILVSTHKEVRDALSSSHLRFTLMYPERGLKEEYMRRFKDRGSPQGFLDLMSANWNKFISELEEQRGCMKFVLAKGEYLFDILSQVKALED